MAYFKRDRFSGIAPGVSPRLLAEQFAQLAENIDFESGRLNPVTDESDTLTLANSTRRSIFFYRDTNWLQWNEDDVSVVEGPIPADTLDRLYWTGQDYPRIGVGSTIISGSSYPQASFRLGVPAPANAPTTSKTGTADSTQTPDDVSYVYTFVTAFGEEGPPSLASTSFERTDTETVTINLPSSDHPSGNYNFGTGAKKRVYRSNTGSTNTQFQFLIEVPFTTTSVSDTTSSFALGEVLPSDTWIGPPDDNTSLYPSGPLQGLIAVANGVFAGFTGKRLCLTEPFLPHAWPIDYRITLEEDIVAIGSVTNGIVALTDGAPYFVTGIDPSAMTAVKLDIAQACINKRSVVDMGDYLLYAGPDGLVAVSGGAGEVVTNGLISPKQWNDNFNPTYRAFRHENTYVAFYSGGGFVYDPRAGEAALSTISYTGEVRGGYMHDKNGELYVIVGNKIKKYRGGTASKTLKWKSKQYVTPKPVSMGWVSVHAQAYPVTVKVWADGNQIAIYTISYSNNAYTQTVTLPNGASTGTLREPIMRLPAVVGQVWEGQVEGSVQIDEVCLAQSMDEIAAL